MDSRALPALILAGALLRLPWIATRPLWLDEALQHWIASAPDASQVIARTVAHDLHPPGFALLTHPFLALADADVVLRAPSFVAGTLAIGVGWAAARAWTGHEGAWLAAGLVATCPPLVAWSREGRPHAVAVMAIATLLWAAGRHRADPNPRTTAWLGVAAVCTVPWTYGAWLATAGILGGLALSATARRGAGLAALAFGAAALPIVVGVAVPQWRAAGFPSHLEVWTGVEGLLVGVPWALGWLATGTRAGPVPVLGLPVAVAVVLGLRRADPVLRGVATGPLALASVAALLGVYPVGPLRHILVAVPSLLVPLTLLRPPKAVGIGAMAMLAAIAIAVAPGVPVVDTPTLLARLAEVRRPGEIVWVHPMLAWPVRRYGAPEEPVVWGGWGEPPEGTWRLAPADVPLPQVVLRADGVIAARSP